MSKLVVEGRVLVVPHLDHAIVDPESVSEVLTDFMTADLDDPVVQVLAVKKGKPLFAIGITLGDGPWRPQAEERSSREHKGRQENSRFRCHVADVIR